MNHRPLTSAQREIWFGQQLHPDEPLYNVGGYLDIRGHIDLSLLARAVTLLLCKHDAMRITLLDAADEDGLPRQTFVEPAAVALPVQDFSAHADARQAALTWMQQRLEVPFTLSSGGALFNFELIKLADDAYWMFQRYHHLIGDGWGCALINRSLADIYTQLAAGVTPQLAGPSYAEFIEDDRRYVVSERFEEDRRYWQSVYAEAPEPLFSQRRVTAVGGVVPRSGHRVLTLESAFYRRLEALAKRHQASIFHVLLGALCVYFARSEQREDLVIGLPVLNRSNARFRQTAGLFVGVNAVRFDCSGEFDFAQLLREIGRTLRANYRHQRFPVSEVSRMLGAGSEGTRLFDIGLSYENPDFELSFAGVEAVAHTMLHGHERTPLMIFVREYRQQQDVKLDFVFNPDFFEASDIDALLPRLHALLDVLPDNDRTPLVQLPIVTAAEVEQLAAWVRTDADYPHDATAVDLFERQAARTPDAPALVGNGERLSYAQLNAWANRIAHALIAQGAGPERCVGICVERLPMMVAAVLGVLKTGAAYVPLAADLPDARKRFVLEDCTAAALIAPPELVGDAPCPVLDPSVAGPEHNPTPRSAAQNLAYLIYTSGSTGTPKGVMIEHAALTNTVVAFNRTYEVKAKDCVLQVAAFGFDVSVGEIFPVLCAGGTLVIAQREDLLDPARFVDLLGRERITIFGATPLLLSQLRLTREQLPALRLIFSGGEALALANLAGLPEDIPVVNGYGPTETTIGATAYRLRRVPEEASRIPIGKPLANYRAYVLDEHQRPLPPGVAGELCIGGVCVARGYLNRPELTAEKFVTVELFGRTERLYRSGDRARWLPDGNLEFLGRMDHQVKLRGFRIELGEIEAALLSQPGVTEAAVLALGEGSGKQLVAYVAGCDLDSTALKTALKSRLPAYMLPAAFVVLERLPLTANGKIDRKALPDPQFTTDEATEAPSDALEEIIAGQWATLLGLNAVGRHDNFFELGGHSLLATQLAARLREALGSDVPVRWLFEAPTVAELAERLRTASEGGTDLDVPPNRIAPGTTHITPDLLPLVTLSQEDIDRVVATVDGGAANVQDIYPLAPLQEGILFHHLLNRDEDPYLGRAQVVFESAARCHAFIDALRAVIARHDILRTAVVWEQLPQPLQVVWRQVELSVEMPHFDPAVGPVADQLREHCHPRHLHLDITRAPLQRVIVAPDGERMLMVYISHHLILDHTTLNALLHEAVAHMQGAAAQLSPPLPFRDFVAQARSLPDEAHQAFFRDMLGDVETPTAPFGLTDVQGDGSATTWATRELAPALAQRLRTQAGRSGATPAALCHLAWALVLARCCGQDDVVFGTVLFGRMQGGAGVERALGMFINTLPLRVTCDARPVAEALRQTQQRLLKLMRHEHAPLGLAQRCSAVPAPMPLFSALFNYRHSAQTDPAGVLPEGVVLLDGDGRTNYPFGLSVDDQGDGLRLSAQVEASLDPDSICALMECALLRLVDALEHAPQTPLTALDILPPNERATLLSWTATDADYPHDATAVDLFEQQAARTPDAPALVGNGERLSYAQLNAWANRIAHALITQGVGPEKVVGICVERSPVMVAAALGVLKTGAAYVPLAVDLPDARKRFVLEDCTAAALIAPPELVGDAPCPVLDPSVAGPEHNPAPRSAAQHLAYLIYTSGSTGTPKGVMIEHAALTNTVVAFNRTYEVKAEDCVLQVAAFGFDVSVGEIFPVLCAGGTLVIAQREDLLDPARFVDLLGRERITIFGATPLLLSQLRFTRDQLPALRIIFSGGEALALANLAGLPEDIPVINGYGPTETTIGATAYRLRRVPEEATRIPIGKPLANYRAYVLDAHLNPLPPGVAGELCIGGVCVARGYLNRPELTAEKFVTVELFGRTERLYRSGDRARWLPDGNLEFLGRMDHQVKLRGFRIELGEIEAALLSQPGVTEAAVLALGEGSGKQLVAYVAGSDLDATALKTVLKSRLPAYMLPAAFVVLERLPLTANGKIDRKALPDPQFTTDEATETPSDALEEIIAGQWATLLGLNAVGRHDNFFELGGHSLLATQLAARLREALGSDIPVRWLFEAPTVAEFAARIRTASEGGTDIDVPPNRIALGTTHITPDLLPLVTLSQEDIDRIVATVDGGAANVQDIYPLAPLQEGILFHHLLDRDEDPYLGRIQVAFESAARCHAFIDALRAVITRHDILRTAVVWEQLPQPLQVVWREVELSVETRHFDPAAGPVADQLFEHCHPRHLHFDITRAPLQRIVIAPDGERMLMAYVSHHLILDHTTLNALLHEAVAHMDGTAAQLPPPLPFRYFVAQARSLPAEAHQAFFRDMLGDVETPTAPFGLTDVQGDGSGTTWATQELAPELSQRLRTQARRSGATPAALCHLAWALVLARCCGQDDVVFGTVLFGRMQGGAGVERALGMFINTLPLRVTCDARPVAEALRQTQQRLLKLMHHEHAPLGLAQRCSAVPSPTPLFSALFNYRHSQQAGDASVPQLDGVEFMRSDGRTNYPLGLSVDDFGDSFRLSAQVDAAIAPERICALMEGALASIAVALEDAPQTPLAALDILPPNERDTLLAWTATDADYPRDATAVDLFEQQAARTPDATAVVSHGERLSYAQLNAWANRIAHALITQGVGPEKVVGICVERAPVMVAAALGVLKTGAAYVPLVADLPDERKRFVLEDCAAAALIAPPELVGDAPCPVIDPSVSGLTHNPAPRSAAQNLAYLIYTSGSTGTPKGVMIEHAALTNTVVAFNRVYEVGAEDCVLQVAAFGFDVSVGEIFPVLCAGGTLVIAQREDLLDPVRFLDLLGRERITIFGATPLLLSQLRFTREQLPALRIIFSGGEALALANLAGLPEDILVINGYGPTETTIGATAYRLRRVPEEATRIPIGKPLANYRTYVLDEHQQPLPPGVAGELCIGGVCVARGYLNRPELTAEKFVTVELFGRTERLYRSGDRARWLPDGHLEFLGRMDHQVKLRGFRIELGEIEAALLSQPGVTEAAVLAIGEGSSKQLVAYVAGRDLDPAPLKTALKSRLPAYMLPAAFVVLARLPLTANGKVDRKALPAPEASTGSAVDEAPRDALEDTVAGQWATVLRLSAVGLHDNFFELGGHSLLATQLAARLREALGSDIPVRWLFEAPTVAELAERIRTAGEDDGDTHVPPNRIAPGTTHITPDLLPLVELSQEEIDRVVATVDGGAANVQDIYPLASLQKGILFHHLLDAEEDPYLGRALLAFDSPQRCQAFVDGLQAVIRRHDILRTSAVWEQLPEPLQVVWRDAEMSVETLHFDPADGPVADQLFEHFHPRRIPSNLTHAPLLRVAIAEDGARTLLIYVSHHLIVDHTTVEELMYEVIVHMQGDVAQLPQPVPFRNFVVQAQRTPTAEHQAFFREMLGDVETPTAPFGLTDVQGSGSGALWAVRDLTPDLSARLRTQAHRHGATPAALCHLAWAMVLARCCNQQDVVFGTVLFGRMQGSVGIERAFGMFINVLPLRVTCDGRPVAEVLRQTQRLLLALMRHEHAPLALAQRCSAVPAPAPLFSALFNYRPHKQASHAGTLPEGVEYLRGDGRTNFPFGLSIDDFGDVFQLATQVDASLDPEHICDLMECALASLTAALEDGPQTPLAGLDILSLNERQTLLGWTATEADVPAEQTTVDLFEAQAARTPEADALVGADRTLSYGELNAWANRIAHGLIALGVGPEDRVAICVERSPAMVAAALGVLKAGAAYVPLATDLPASRRRFIIDDCGAAALIAPTEFADEVPCPRLDPDLAGPMHDLQRRSGPGQLAYLIYTSGSTGTPKGVMIEHAALTNTVVAFNRAYEVSESDRVLQVASFAFDVSVGEIFPILCAGGTLVIAPREDVLDPARFLDLLGRERITIFGATPLLLSQLSFTREQLPALRIIFSGGEALALSNLAGLPPEVPVINGYGPTETTIGATAYRIQRSEEEARCIPIGQPLANYRIYVLDEHLRPLPLGVAGELCIGGVGVARGYLNRPELTAEKFVTVELFGRQERLYRSGDRARWLPDGHLEFLGRMDHQVKLRGFRIELGEIEAALLSQPGVTEAAMLAIGEGSGKQLVAYVAGRDLDPDALQTALKSRLPAYMLPAAFVVLARLPLTANGKIDRQALPDPETPDRVSSGGRPRNAVELLLTQVWQEVLDLPAADIHTDFFAAGGHSLLTVRLMGCIRERFGRTLPVAAIYQHPTIAELAPLLAADDGTLREFRDWVPLQPHGTQPPLYVLAGAGSHALHFHSLAQHLGGDQPVFGLETPGLYDVADIPPSIETHAARLLATLRRHARTGPYRFAGHSAGALVAFELARQLEAQGETVAQLIVLDALAPNPQPQMAPSPWQALCAVATLLETLAHTPLGLGDELTQPAADDAAYARVLAHLRSSEAVAVLGLSADDVERVVAVYHAMARNHAAYNPQAMLRCPIVLAQTTESANAVGGAPDWGWQAYTTASVRVVRCPGTHVSMLTEPHVATLAALLGGTEPPAP